MKQLIEFPSETGKSILVEVESIDDEFGEKEVSRIAKKAAQTFQEALETTKPIAEAIIDKLGNLSQRPQEIGVEFGLKLNAETGAIIASSGIEANFKVSLKWKQEQASGHSG